ncbi:MAG: PAS domain-containing sensor histidine kinase [Myxococcota bacterium]|nr:PAS domain-containing sensor histidine kinase [Myxococcota bacterium]
MKRISDKEHLILPALLDALGYTGTGVMMLMDRGDGLERIWASEAAAQMLGYTLEEFNAIAPLEKIAPEQRGLVNQLSTSFREGAPVPPALELTALAKDGTHVAVELAMGHFRIPDGVAYVMVMRLMSPSSQLTMLEADRIGLVGALAAGFAHEINNPLTSVLLNLRSLRKQLCANLPEQAQPQALRCLDDVNAGAERIAGNVRALQTLATRSETKPIDLAAVVSASLRLAAPTLEPRAHVIRQIFPVPPVSGEESRIGQAVLAMMLFSSSGFADEMTTGTANRIVVCVEERTGSVIVEVSDNGRDLTSEEARRAFDPFFRSPSRGAGVGVGLGVARSVAAALGGEVTLAPRTGGGAVITMSLPTATGL